MLAGDQVDPPSTETKTTPSSLTGGPLLADPGARFPTTTHRRSPGQAADTTSTPDRAGTDVIDQLLPASELLATLPLNPNARQSPPPAQAVAVNIVVPIRLADQLSERAPATASPCPSEPFVDARAPPDEPQPPRTTAATTNTTNRRQRDTMPSGNHVMT